MIRSQRSDLLQNYIRGGLIRGHLAGVSQYYVDNGLLEITCQQELLTECALSQGHIQASERTEYNYVCDHL